MSMYLPLIGGLIIDLAGLPILFIISIILFITATFAQVDSNDLLIKNFDRIFSIFKAGAVF
jgi:hypothetical protein